MTECLIIYAVLAAITWLLSAIFVYAEEAYIRRKYGDVVYSVMRLFVMFFGLLMPLALCLCAFQKMYTAAKKDVSVVRDSLKAKRQR